MAAPPADASASLKMAPVREQQPVDAGLVTNCSPVVAEYAKPLVKSSLASPDKLKEPLRSRSCALYVA